MSEMSEMSAAPESTGAEIVQFRPRNPLNVKVSYAKELAESGLLPASYRKQPANVLYAIEFGEMLGLSPMAAITGVHVIDGKPTASAALISALVRRAGHRLRVTGDGQKAVAQIIRSDDPDFTFESVWTIDRAKQANLTNKNVWRQYPAAMLKARAITEVARDACEEALSGVHYTPEELGANVDEEGLPVGGTLVEQVDPSIDWDTKINMCRNSIDMLRELYKPTKPGAPVPPADVKKRILARVEEIKTSDTKASEGTAAEASEESAPEVVDAEIVDELAPVNAPAPKPAQRRLTKTEQAKQAVEMFDQLLTCSSFDVADRLAQSAPAVDITAWVKARPDVREALDIKDGETVTLAAFAQLVADYVSLHDMSVMSAIDGGEAA